MIRAARPEEAGALSALALRSKAHWGYDAAFLEAVRHELTWSPEGLARDDVLVEERGGRPAGFAIVQGDPPAGLLAAVFVDPPAIGGGTGRRLVAAVLGRARSAGFRTLDVEADPNAEGFYLRLGAVVVGRTPSGSIPGRTLPLLRFDLAGASRPAEERLPTSS